MLAALALKPGLVADETPLSSEGGFTGGDRVRFVKGRLQSIGGWAPYNPLITPGIVRGAHDWSDLDGLRLLAYGTETTLYALHGGARVDITPVLTEGVLTAPFTTKAGSSLVIANHPRHGLYSGDPITYTNASLIGGVALNGTYRVTVRTPDSYQIDIGTVIGSDLVSGSTDTVDYSAGLPAGNTDGFISAWGSGNWGIGAWNASTYGQPTTVVQTAWGEDTWNSSTWGGSVWTFGGPASTDTEPRIWSMDNMGPRLVVNPRGRGIYEWQPVLSPPETVVDGIFSDASAWVAGTGWTVTGGEAVATAGTASVFGQQTQDRLDPGAMYRVTFDVVMTAGSVSFLNGGPAGVAASVGEASIPITQSGTYSRLFRATPGITQLGFSKDALFAGRFDNLSVRLEHRAYQIKGAPRYVDWIFLDASRALVALACEGFDGVHNAMLARWSALEDVEEWTPLDDNVAGELPLASGTRLLTGCNIRQENLLLSDTTAFRFQFAGGSSGFVQREIGSGCGAVGRNALIEWNGVAYWMSMNGFYQYSGGAPQKIPCPVERYVIDDLARYQREKIYAGINPDFNEVWWLYPSITDGNECSRAVCFNFAENLWTLHSLARTCWIAGGTFKRPIAFSPDGFMFEHEIGTNGNGAPIDWWTETAALDVEDGESLELITGLLPDVKDQLGDVVYTVWCRQYPNGPDLPPDTRVATPGDKAIRFRRKGRQARFRVSSSALESRFHMGAPRLDLAKSEAKQ